MRSLAFLTIMLFAAFSDAQPATFNANDQPPAPDYSLPQNWSCLPFRKDAADVIPASEQWVDDSLKEVDVFYIYPTIYMGGKTWNEDLSNAKLNKRIDEKPVRYQASVFNASCRVYVPRYRQACIRAFFQKENGEKSLDFAYQDVKRAFQYYLDHYNHGRPIIIASHSQGTHHARRLLKEFFDETDLRKRLVAAYVVGFGFDESLYKNLKPCDKPTQTGCYVTWASFKKGYDPVHSPLYGTVCVNPVTWTRDTINVDRSKSMGAILLDFNKTYAQACETEIHHHYLWVKAHMPFVGSWTNLHIVDYNLFWFDIRKNVKDRVQAFLKK
jgi:hypothetical protein